MSSDDERVNTSLVGIFLAVGFPLALCALGLAYFANFTAQQNKGGLENLVATIEQTDSDVLAAYVDQISDQSVRATQSRLEEIVDARAAEARANLDAEISVLRAQGEDIHAELQDALTTIDHLIVSRDLDDVLPEDVLIEADLAYFEDQSIMPSPGAGLSLFTACAACHSVSQGGASGIGPNLWGVYNQRSAKTPDFAYSEALASYELDWTAENLNGFLTNPRGYLRGTSMGYAGMPNVQDRADLIAYLATLK